MGRSSFCATGLLARPDFYHLAQNSICALVVHCLKKTITIQYGYRKCGTNARVFSKTLARAWNRGGMHKSSYGRLSKRRSNSPRRVLGLAVSVPI